MIHNDLDLKLVSHSYTHAKKYSRRINGDVLLEETAL